MKLKISPELPVAEVQKRFTEMFPYLRLEFYRNADDVKRGARMNEKQRIGNCQIGITDSSLTISPTMTVRELEENFKEQFTLTVQVFRKSGTIWLQTTIT